MNDMVNKPPHYQHPSGLQSIDIKELLPSNLGDAWKYVFRAGSKFDAIEDLKKAKWYLRRFKNMASYLRQIQTSHSTTVEEMIKRDLARILEHEEDPKRRALLNIVDAALYNRDGAINDADVAINRMIKEIKNAVGDSNKEETESESDPYPHPEAAQ